MYNTKASDEESNIRERSLDVVDSSDGNQIAGIPESGQRLIARRHTTHAHSRSTTSNSITQVEPSPRYWVARSTAQLRPPNTLNASDNPSNVPPSSLRFSTTTKSMPPSTSSSYLPLLACPICGPTSLLTSPTTLQCGHTVCASHLLPEQPPSPSPSKAESEITAIGYHPQTNQVPQHQVPLLPPSKLHHAQS